VQQRPAVVLGLLVQAGSSQVALALVTILVLAPALVARQDHTVGCTAYSAVGAAAIHTPSTAHRVPGSSRWVSEGGGKPVANPTCLRHF